MWTFLNYTCDVPTGTTLPSIIRLTLNYNATLGNPNNGPVQNAAYMNQPGVFQSFVNALGPFCSTEAFYIDSYQGGESSAGHPCDRDAQIKSLASNHAHHARDACTCRSGHGQPHGGRLHGRPQRQDADLHARHHLLPDAVQLGLQPAQPPAALPAYARLPRAPDHPPPQPAV